MQPAPGYKNFTFLVPKNCGEIFKSGKKQNGVYTINPDGLGNFQVWCDMKTDGGGWTVFQSRHNESVDFYRVWQDYKNGFGDVHGNFWLGLEQIYRLTNSGANVLRVELMSWTNESGYAKYKSFYVASESNFYALKLGGFSGKYGEGVYYSGSVLSGRSQGFYKTPLNTG